MLLHHWGYHPHLDCYRDIMLGSHFVFRGISSAVLARSALQYCLVDGYILQSCDWNSQSCCGILLLMIILKGCRAWGRQSCFHISLNTWVWKELRRVNSPICWLLSWCPSDGSIFFPALFLCSQEGSPTLQEKILEGNLDFLLSNVPINVLE